VGLFPCKQCSINGFHDTVDLTINVVIPKSQDFVSGTRQRIVARNITLPALVHSMLAAVDLYDEPLTTAFEIHDVR
jgi:hypothetical protein